MVAPGSPVPLTAEPLACSMTGASGSVVSTVSVSGALTLPAGSAWVAVSTVPLGTSVAGSRLQVPSAATVAVPMTLLAGSLTVTTAPGSPLPVMRVPLVGARAGAARGVASTVKAVPLAVMLLPAGSVAVMTGV